MDDKDEIQKRLKEVEKVAHAEQGGVNFFLGIDQWSGSVNVPTLVKGFFAF